ncbi:uncharacterized protein LOC133511370 isoform X4 [Syngnathoides biaculeatus]|uniref:uncharacterized protein LOC133511370 isoform X4 n=1 Tax=Syngnathoides biaculeatus TaxID=300417 RepID=UPI002ADE2283|nr:uncharacterized protein LOC133511370 isoform X4 [Syngnathoides biaculeatus]
MEANPDLPGAEVDRWLSHLKHHLRRYAKEKESKTATSSVQTERRRPTTCTWLQSTRLQPIPRGRTSYTAPAAATGISLSAKPAVSTALWWTVSAMMELGILLSQPCHLIRLLPGKPSHLLDSRSIFWAEISSSPRALSSNAALMDLSWNFRMVTRTAALPPLPPVPPPSFRLLNNALWHAPLLTSIGQEWILTPVVGSRLSTFGLSGNLGSVISDLMIW